MPFATMLLDANAMLLALHAPDGLFSLPVNLLFAAAVVLLLAAAVVQLRRGQDHRLVPVMGIMAAFVFAGQMVNFPVAAGTTGHLLGGVLAAVLLGPWAASLVLATVVFFQALLGDGGLTALGPNIFNMGVIGTFFGYYIYRAALAGAVHKPARIVAATFFAAWSAVVLASIVVSLQLAASGTAALRHVLLPLVGVHALIGVGEAIITAFVIAFVLKTRPELIYDRRPGPEQPRPGRATVAFGLSAALCVALFLSLLPSLWDYPDGLEYIGAEHGFVAEEPLLAEDGALLTLPAYPLGVRLGTVADRVTAIHEYELLSAGVAPGDIIESIAGQPIVTLADAEAALESAVGQRLQVTIRRAGQSRDLTLPPVNTTLAGASEPMVALLPDYAVPGIDGPISTSLAGAIGTIVMFLASLAVGRLLVRPGRLARVLAQQSASSDHNST